MKRAQNILSLLARERPYTGLIAALFVGFSVSLLAFLLIQKWEKEALQNAFRYLADLHIASFEREIDVDLEVVRGLQKFIRVQPNVTRLQFGRFARAATDIRSSIQALEWIPRVSDQHRDLYETAAREDGLEGFRFTERNAAGDMVVRSPSDEYFPVFYLEPMQGNEAAVGFDLSSTPARQTALNQARDLGGLLASEPIKLLQETGRNLGILVFHPVYDGPFDSLESRRQNLKGFALGVYRVGAIFVAALEKSRMETGLVTIKLLDQSSPDAATELYAHLPEAWEDVAAMEYGRRIDVAGRTWTVLSRPTNRFITAKKSWTSYLVLAAGIALSLLLASYVNHLASRARDVRRLVTARTRELQISEAKIRAILDTAVNAIIVIDEQGSMQLFNPGAQKMFQYSDEEVITKNVKLLMPEPYHSAHDGYLSNFRSTGERHIIGIGREVVGKRKDGSVFPIHLSVGQSQVEGTSQYVGIITDITAQKDSERALIKAKEQAEESNRMKSEFINMMSHELRTPLTVVLGYLPLLKKADSLPKPEVIAQIAVDIEASGEHLLTLINDLLDISKIEAGRMELRLERLEVNEVVADVVRSLQIKAQAKGIQLTKEIEPGTVYADRVRLRQILLNLIGNAIKFTDHGGITVTTKLRGQEMEFAVSDTGCGIADKDLSIIFEKFRQVDSSSTRAAGGTGLGLAITRRLIELHDGTISVESVQGEGSRFQFHLPLSEE